MRIRLAAVQYADAIARVINEAFRIPESLFIDGDRTNSEEVRAMLDTGAFLLTGDANGLLCCVHVEIRGNRGYFGLLAVEPPRSTMASGER